MKRRANSNTGARVMSLGSPDGTEAKYCIYLNH